MKPKMLITTCLDTKTTFNKRSLFALYFDEQAGLPCVLLNVLNDLFKPQIIGNLWKINKLIKEN